MSLLKPKNGTQWAMLLGGAVLAGYALKVLVFDKMTAHANFANSSNSVYPVHDTDLGDSMNTISPHSPGLIHDFVPVHHHGGHITRSFPDYTDRSNSLPVPFLEHNIPIDTFNADVSLANINDKGVYIQTYNGNSFGSA